MEHSVQISQRIDYLPGLLADLTPYKVPRHLLMNNDGKVYDGALLDGRGKAVTSHQAKTVMSFTGNGQWWSSHRHPTTLTHILDPQL